jgi:putative colanic acid biosynthesis acetyltransferase WcaF
MCDSTHGREQSVPLIDLSEAPGERVSWGRPSWTVYLWSIVEIVLVTNPFQISSRVRVAALRAFGAKIGSGVIFRPRTRVKFPWNLEVGDRSWIGEGVWIHNQAPVMIGTDVVLSQECFITTGSHAHRTDMALVTSATTIGSGTWVAARAIVLGGSSFGRSCLVSPGSVVGPMQIFPDGAILKGNPGTVVGRRLSRKES